MAYICSPIRGNGVWRSWLAHLVWDQRVLCSSHSTPTKKRDVFQRLFFCRGTGGAKHPCTSMPRGSAPIVPRGSAFRICLWQIHGSRRRAGARGIRNGKGMMTHVISPRRRKRHLETVSDYCKQPIISTVQPKAFPGHHFCDPVPPVCLPTFLPDDLRLSR